MGMVRSLDVEQLIRRLLRVQEVSCRDGERRVTEVSHGQAWLVCMVHQTFVGSVGVYILLA